MHSDAHYKLFALITWLTSAAVTVALLLSVFA